VRHTRTRDPYADLGGQQRCYLPRARTARLKSFEAFSRAITILERTRP